MMGGERPILDFREGLASFLETESCLSAGRRCPLARCD